MGYAPMSQVNAPPSPATSGTTCTLTDDTFDRFPEVPFTGLFFQAQTLPREGVDSETVTVNILDHDTVCFTRGPVPVAITSGMMLSALAVETVYSIEEVVTLSQEFPVGDTGMTLAIRDPQGNLATPALDALGHPSAGGSTFAYADRVTKPGQWHYEFYSNERVFPEQDFFVRFSDVL
jgi:hypothetical protein